MPYRPHFLFLFLALLALLSAGLACGGAGSASEPEPIAEQTALATQMEPGDEQPIIANTQVPSIPERRRLTLEYPPQIRAGDSDIVRLTLEVDEAGNITPTAVVDGNVITGEVIEIPNLYETHHVVAEARFDVTGLQASPPDLTSQTITPGQTVRFFWSIRSEEEGIYRGTVWLYLRFVDKVSGEESQRAVSAQMVEIEAVKLLGIPANVVRFAGGVGSVVGAIIGFPFFEDILKFLFARRRGRRSK